MKCWLPCLNALMFVVMQLPSADGWTAGWRWLSKKWEKASTRWGITHSMSRQFCTYLSLFWLPSILVNSYIFPNYYALDIVFSLKKFMSNVWHYTNDVRWRVWHANIIYVPKLKCQHEGADISTEGHIYLHVTWVHHASSVLSHH